LDDEIGLAALVAPVAAARWGPGFDPADVEVVSVSDINRGRGVFSRVLRVTVASRAGSSTERRWTVVAKLPAEGPNGAAARRQGAYQREALAYRSLLPRSPVRSPRAHLVRSLSDGALALLLEDLSDRRQVDQLDGLESDDALAVAGALRRFHHHWARAADLEGLPVRRSVPSALPAEGLLAGLATLDDQWSQVVTGEQRAAYHRLVTERDALAEAFAAAGPPTLCHGDPRADNLVFDEDGEPVLFDWQQLAVQFGPADLAWLAATSLRTDVRRDLEVDLLARYGTTIDHYRLGLVLPGLAVLLLAQRHLGDDRARRFVATSLTRIGNALADHHTGH
jgi:hypothetical protein